MTNYEKIKSMSIEEMAKMLCDMCKCCDVFVAFDLFDIRKKSDCNGFIKWLKSEVKENV